MNPFSRRYFLKSSLTLGALKLARGSVLLAGPNPHRHEAPRHRNPARPGQG